MKMLLLGVITGALLTLAVQRAWRWLTSAPSEPDTGPETEYEPARLGILRTDELPAPRAARPAVVAYCPFCVRPHQLADPSWQPVGAPRVCWQHGTGSVLTERQARAVIERMRAELKARGLTQGAGPFLLDPLQPWPPSAHVMNASN